MTVTPVPVSKRLPGVPSRQSAHARTGHLGAALRHLPAWRAEPSFFLSSWRSAEMNLETSAGVKVAEASRESAQSDPHGAGATLRCCCCCQQGGPDKFEGEREREGGAHTHAHITQESGSSHPRTTKATGAPAGSAWCTKQVLHG